MLKLREKMQRNLSNINIATGHWALIGPGDLQKGLPMATGETLKKKKILRLTVNNTTCM